MGETKKSEEFVRYEGEQEVEAFDKQVNQSAWNSTLIKIKWWPEGIRGLSFIIDCNVTDDTMVARLVPWHNGDQITHLRGCINT